MITMKRPFATKNDRQFLGAEQLDCNAFRDDWLKVKIDFDAGAMTQEMFDYNKGRLTSNPIPEHCPDLYAEITGKQVPADLSEIGASPTLPQKGILVPLLAVAAGFYFFS